LETDLQVDSEETITMLGAGFVGSWPYYGLMGALLLVVIIVWKKMRSSGD
jgi:hypothetical protein